MAKSPAPFNGPSTTGNPSGGGRGNNDAWNDDDGGGATAGGGWGGGGYLALRGFTSPSGDLSRLGARPEPKRISAGEMKEHLAEAADHSVAMITQTTYSKLRSGLLELHSAYSRPGSKECQGMSARDVKTHAEAARISADRVRSGRLDTISLLVRKARLELTRPEADDIEKRVARSLGALQRHLLAKKLGAEEGMVSRAVRGRVTIAQVLTYLEI